MLLLAQLLHYRYKTPRRDGGAQRVNIHNTTQTQVLHTRGMKASATQELKFQLSRALVIAASNSV